MGAPAYGENLPFLEERRFCAVNNIRAIMNNAFGGEAPRNLFENWLFTNIVKREREIKNNEDAVGDDTIDPLLPHPRHASKHIINTHTALAVADAASGGVVPKHADAVLFRSLADSRLLQRHLSRLNKALKQALEKWHKEWKRMRIYFNSHSYGCNIDDGNKVVVSFRGNHVNLQYNNRKLILSSAHYDKLSLLYEQTHALNSDI